jgi:hypothetical protein
LRENNIRSMHGASLPAPEDSSNHQLSAAAENQSLGRRQRFDQIVVRRTIREAAIIK